EKILASQDEEDKKAQPEARYLLGVAKFRTGDAAGATPILQQVLASKESGAFRDDAAYLLFKGSEANYAAAPTPEHLATFEQAVNTLVTEFPKHKAVPEARFRLGEIRQKQERYRDAIAQFVDVKGDPSFEVRAAFASAQCSVRML